MKSTHITQKMRTNQTNKNIQATKPSDSHRRESTWRARPTATTASCMVPGSTLPAKRRKFKLISIPCWRSRLNQAPRNTPSSTTTNSGLAVSTNTPRLISSPESPVASRNTAMPLRHGPTSMTMTRDKTTGNAGTTSMTPTLVTTTPCRTTLNASSTTSDTPSNSPTWSNRCSSICPLTPQPWRGTWSCPAISPLSMTRRAASGFSGTNGDRQMAMTIYYSGAPFFDATFCVAVLYFGIEFAQLSIIQWMIQRETIAMNTDQTVRLINLLSKKRAESGLSVAEVARRAHVAGGRVWRIEQGMIATPKAESLKAIGTV